MKIEIEVSAFGQEEVQGTADAFKRTELMRVYELSSDTTLAQVHSILTALFNEVESGYPNPEQCLAKLTIRAKKQDGEITFLG